MTNWQNKRERRWVT